jgi:cell division protein FtsI/penicillin-binding protein 2
VTLQKGRITFLRTAVVLAIAVLVSRLFWVQVVKAEEIARRTEEMRLTRQTVTPVRGAIFDRNMVPLAVSVPSYLVVADQIQMQDSDEPVVASKLAPLLSMKPEEILKKLRDNPDSGYIPLKGNLNLAQKEQVEALNLRGIAVVQQVQRSYPQKSLANQVLGYLADGKGAAGLEARYDKELSGEPGYVVAEFTYNNIPIESTIKEKRDPVPGRNLVLTLDASLQRLAEAKLDEVIKQYEAKRALVMAMDVQTGEILVMAMRPGADPGDRKTWGDPVDYARLNNWAVTPMSPGSIFKPITTAAALEEGAITLSTTFIDKGEMWIDGWRLSNWDGYVSPNPAPMTVAELLQRSSNVGMVQVGERLGRQKFENYLKGFGFLEKTGIDLDYEESANFGTTSFAQKSNIDWANMYIGQHLEVTPVQMITAIAAIANGGHLVQPHVVREIRDPDGTVVWTAPTTPKRTVISPETAKEVRELMISVIEKGTAKAAQPKGYSVGGKTGTAQKFENGRMKDRMLADFVGFAPAQKPQVVMLVMVDEPKGQGYGGIVAAPIFAELMPHVMRAVGVAPDRPVDAAPQQATVQPQPMVPDVTWLPTAWAEARLAEAGFVPRVKGTGTVVTAQSLQPGSVARAGTVVELTLGAAGNGQVRVPDFSGLSLAEANRLATEIGLTLKAAGSGFVTAQQPQKGATVPARSTISVTLAPRR